MSLLRVYKKAECDGLGFPLDWERCRRCKGVGSYVQEKMSGPVRFDCEDCGGHGSLKAAALHHFGLRCGATDETPAGTATCNRLPHEDRWHSEMRDGNLWAGWGGGEPHPFPVTLRCEDCGHPMSEGTLEDHEGNRVEDREFHRLFHDVRGQVAAWTIHYSPCDEGCRHGGRIRVRSRYLMEEDGTAEWEPVDWQAAQSMITGFLGWDIEASWRPVDVRTLDWPHDLRPESLAVLCLRCWAAR